MIGRFEYPAGVRRYIDEHYDLAMGCRAQRLFFWKGIDPGTATSGS